MASSSKPSKASVVLGDCLTILPSLPDASIDLVLTSPPYCMGKDYESDSDVSTFLRSHARILPEIVRVVRPGGSICWQVGSHVADGILTPLDFLVHQVAASIGGIALRNRIVWTFGHGHHARRRFSGRYETILWYTKGEPYHFNLDAVRVPQKYPGKRHYRGPRKGQYSGNLLGKNPSDVWEIPNIKSNHVEKTSHPCQFPVALAMRLIAALTPPGGAVLDPFTGSGTTGAAAVLLGREFRGIEKFAKYVRIANKRIADAAAGVLPYRAPETAVHVPSNRSAVASLPAQFAEARAQTRLAGIRED